MRGKIKASVYGATGFTGRELISILSRHPSVELDRIYSRSFQGKKISEVFPTLKGVADMRLSMPSPERQPPDSDAVFLALPHRKSMEYVPGLVKKEILTIDMSADYRFESAGDYQQEYSCTHTDSANIEQAVYGLPEINREKIKNARLIANPGCYATAVILALYPLVREGVLTGTAFVDAKSGISGAGKKLDSEFLFSSRYENVTPYKVNSHRHIKEITSFISVSSKRKWEGLFFCPHLIPADRGILANIYAEIGEGKGTKELLDIYSSYYGNQEFIHICPEGRFPQVSDTAKTNNCFIGAGVLGEGGKTAIVSSIDNLVKGASGQAVQNLNIAMGFRETEGLR